MDLSAITSIASGLDTSRITQSLQSAYDTASASKEVTATDESKDSFAALYQSALDLLNTANDTQNQVEVEEMNYLLGYSENTNALSIAQEKADVALEYTIAVRDKFLESYQDIMNMSF
jgi:flagellar hook-basal body complex protein FliE